MCTFSERDCRSPFPEVPVNQRNRCAAANRVRRLLRLTGVSDSFGAGTITRVRSSSSWQPCVSSSRSSDPPEPRPRRTSAVPGNHRVSSATAALRRINHRPPCACNPPSCASLRSGLSSSAFGVLTVGFGPFTPLAARLRPCSAISYRRTVNLRSTVSIASTDRKPQQSYLLMSTPNHH